MKSSALQTKINHAYCGSRQRGLLCSPKSLHLLPHFLAPNPPSSTPTHYNFPFCFFVVSLSLVFDHRGHVLFSSVFLNFPLDPQQVDAAAAAERHRNEGISSQNNQEQTRFEWLVVEPSKSQHDDSIYKGNNLKRSCCRCLSLLLLPRHQHISIH